MPCLAGVGAALPLDLRSDSASDGVHSVGVQGLQRSVVCDGADDHDVRRGR